MKTITLDVPESLDLDKQEITLFLACKLYEQGKLSLGQAAEMAGFIKRTFMELLSRYNVSLFNYDSSELENDVANAGNDHL